MKRIKMRTAFLRVLICALLLAGFPTRRLYIATTLRCTIVLRLSALFDQGEKPIELLTRKWAAYSEVGPPAKGVGTVISSLYSSAFLLNLRNLCLRISSSAFQHTSEPHAAEGLAAPPRVTPEGPPPSAPPVCTRRRPADSSSDNNMALTLSAHRRRPPRRTAGGSRR